MSTCSDSSSRSAILSGNRLRMFSTSLRGSCNAARTPTPTARPWVVSVASAAEMRDLQALVGLVGGQERHLVDHHQDERVLDGRGVVALDSGEPARPFLHDLDGRLPGGRRSRPDRRRTGRRTGRGRRTAPSAWDPAPRSATRPARTAGSRPADGGPDERALARPGGARDQDVCAVDLEPPRRAVLALADLDRPDRVPPRGIGSAGNGVGQRVTPGEGQQQPARPGDGSPGRRSRRSRGRGARCGRTSL